MTAWYNEIEPYAAQWLRNLSGAGHIAQGQVDERDVRAIRADELPSGTQCHFFAGIGAWGYALRLAGWPDDLEVWTGSCPCQPFSQANSSAKGVDDERHLFPAWRCLIEERLPPVVFGEQVASPAGRAWLDAARAEMEALGYAVAASDLCAAGVGAPHIRQRLFWVALAGEERLEGVRVHLRQRAQGQGVPQAARGGPGGFWSEVRCVPRGDGGSRHVAPGVELLAHGSPEQSSGVGAAGNAIVPQVAAEFIGAVMEELVA